MLQRNLLSGWGALDRQRNLLSGSGVSCATAESVVRQHAQLSDSVLISCLAVKSVVCLLSSSGICCLATESVVWQQKQLSGSGICCLAAESVAWLSCGKQQNLLPRGRIRCLAAKFAVWQRNLLYGSCRSISHLFVTSLPSSLICNALPVPMLR